jgi:4-hydroxybenzoate polyprenyltransferase
MRWLLWTNILISGSAAGWVILSLRTWRLPVDWTLAALAFTLTLGFYTRDRLDKQERQADRRTMPKRTAWIERNDPALNRVVRGSFLSAAGLIALRPTALLPLLVGAGFALSYTLRWLPWRGRTVGWKHLPGMKMPFVAILWTLTTVITPATVYRRLWRSETWVLAGAVCALVMIQILLNDLRDEEGDRAAKTLSLPALTGQRVARRVGYGLAIVAALLAFASLPVLLTALYSALLLLRYRPKADARWRGWIEGQGVAAAMLSLVIANC